MGRIELNSDQIFAGIEASRWWHSASSDQIFEISGAAGTGKTTSIKYILQEFAIALDKFIAPCDPGDTQHL